MKKKGKRRKRSRRTAGLNYMQMIIGAAALLVLILIITGVRGCGVSHKSPEGVVEALIKSSVDGNEKKMKDCYGAKKDTPKQLQTEIEAAVKYFEAHNVTELEIQECDVLSESEKYTYVYIVYDLVLENEQKYPCIATYMTGKQEEGYFVLPPSKITDEMREQAAADYAKFMTTDIYRNYTKAYDTFMKKNPGYEDKIAGKLV